MKGHCTGARVSNLGSEMVENEQAYFFGLCNSLLMGLGQDQQQHPRQTDGRTDRQTDRKTETGQTDKQSERSTVLVLLFNWRKKVHPLELTQRVGLSWNCVKK